MLSILFSLVFYPFVFIWSILVVSSVFFIFCFFCFLFLFSLFFCWGNLGYIFGCDYVSFGLILLSFWICVLIVLASESVFRFNYFSCFLLVFLLIMLTFSSVSFFFLPVFWG